jgi:hypothetical protein
VLYNNDSLTLYTIGGSVITVETLSNVSTVMTEPPIVYKVRESLLYNTKSAMFQLLTEPPIVYKVRESLLYSYITMTLSLYILLVVQS